MTLEERSNLVLAFARVLYVNGQATEQTVAAAEQLGLLELALLGPREMSGVSRHRPKLTLIRTLSPIAILFKAVDS